MVNLEEEEEQAGVRRGIQQMLSAVTKKTIENTG